MSNPKRRWGDRPTDDDEAALAALLNESNARDEKKAQDNGNRRPQRPDGGRGGSRWDNSGRGGRGDGRDDRYRPPHERAGHNNRYQGKPIVEDDRDRGSAQKRRRRWNDKDPEGPERWGESARDDKPEEEGEKPEKVKAEFGLSGALATDTKTGNVRNGGE